MTTSQLSPVSFHGNTLFLIPHKGEPFTPMRPIVEGMGMDWASQYRKLSTNKERWVVVMLTTTVEGQRKEVVCMPVRKLPAYLGTISPAKVRPELKDRIITYQNECDNVLWKHWAGQQAALTASPIPQPLPSPLATPAQRKPLDKLIKVWATLLGGDGGVYSRLWTQVDSHLGIISIDSATPEQIRQGIIFVQGKIDALQQKALPEAMPQAPSGHNPYSKREAELLSLLEEIDNIKATTRRAYESLLDRLGEITGPMYKDATRAMGYTGRDRSGRGYASDYVISSLHSYRYQVSEHIRNANECAHDAVRTGITVCRILGAR